MIAGVAVPPQHGGGEARAPGRLAMDRDRVIASGARRRRLAAERDRRLHRDQRYRCVLCTLHGTINLPSLHIMTIISTTLLWVAWKLDYFTSKVQEHWSEPKRWPNYQWCEMNWHFKQNLLIEPGQFYYVLVVAIIP